MVMIETADAAGRLLRRLRRSRVCPREILRIETMQALTLMQGALSAVSSLFGGLGVFFLYHSFAVPQVSAYALIFLGSATAIVWSTQYSKRRT